jgi:predicted nuclease of predicted toxin-antitoxin system
MPDACPSLYLDEDVSAVLGAILCARGFNALTVRDAKELGRTDIEQLKLAKKDNRVLLTHN